MPQECINPVRSRWLQMILKTYLKKKVRMLKDRRLRIVLFSFKEHLTTSHFWPISDFTSFQYTVKESQSIKSSQPWRTVWYHSEGEPKPSRRSCSQVKTLLVKLLKPDGFAKCWNTLVLVFYKTTTISRGKTRNKSDKLKLNYSTAKSFGKK